MTTSLAAIAILGSASPETTGGLNAELIIWLVVLLLVVVVGAFILVFVRRRMHPAGADSPKFSFNLETLREMRNKGELSEDEFKKACEHLRRDASENEAE